MGRGAQTRRCSFKRGMIGEATARLGRLQLTPCLAFNILLPSGFSSHSKFAALLSPRLLSAGRHQDEMDEYDEQLQEDVFLGKVEAASAAP